MSDAPRVILLIYPNAAYDSAVLRGIMRYSREHGPWVFYLSCEYPGLPLTMSEAVNAHDDRISLPRSATRSRFRLPSFEDWGATGVLGRLQTPAIVDQVMDSKLPVVAVDLARDQLVRGSKLSKVSELYTDSHNAGRLAAEHLMERGFQRFAFCGYAGRTWSNQRLEGFRQRLRDACFSCEVYEPPTTKSMRYWDREASKVQAWVRSLPKPIGLFTCNDVRGRQVLESCLLSSISVPGEIAIVSSDNEELICTTTEPTLSSIAYDAEEGGYQAAALLDALMRNPKMPTERRMSRALRVVARRSTDIIAVDDPSVSTAMRFIRERIREPIGVEDIVKQSGTSRRSLELKFRQVLGISIGKDILRARLSAVERLLVDTDLPAWRIAELTGFNSLQYLSRVFHRELQVPLGEYRMRHRAW
jgi:LacI family transcriptional regulator